MTTTLSYFLLWLYNKIEGNKEEALDAASAFLVSINSDGDVIEDGLLDGMEPR